MRHYDLDCGLLDAVLKGEINPGRVFTDEYDLDLQWDAHYAGQSGNPYQRPAP